jgi:hypothetical protein
MTGSGCAAGLCFWSTAEAQSALKARKITPFTDFHLVHDHSQAWQILLLAGWLPFGCARNLMTKEDKLTVRAVFETDLHEKISSPA